MRLANLPKWVLPTVCSAVAFGAGTIAGMFVTDRRYKKVVDGAEVEQLKFDFNMTEFDREVNKATYVIRKMRDESETLVSNIRDIAILKDIPVSPSRENHPSNQHPDPKAIVVENKEMVNVFPIPDTYDGWDYTIEMQRRDPRSPYVIHRDEFFNDEMGFGAAGDQRTFTWYAGDDILTDESDIPIYNSYERVGELKFGYGSGDPSIVYIRNEKEEEEYEIVMDDGSYQTIVLGKQIEQSMAKEDIKHSRAPGKFKRDD